MKKHLVILLVLLFTQITSWSQYANALIKANQDAAILNLVSNNRNIDLDPNGIIHIFIYQDGTPLRKGFPTTATEKDLFRVHLYKDAANTDAFSVDFIGTFAPSLNINQAAPLAFVAPSIVVIDFAIMGPYTGTVNITIKKTTIAGVTTVIATPTIQIAKTIHVSIGSGLVFSSLRDPSNIRKVPASQGSVDSVLVADDPRGRGLLVLFATFYPWGRNNLMLRSSKFKDHFGILIGTTIASGSNNFRDALVGFQYDFSAGGSIVAGGHYGRRQRIKGIEYRDFKFNETIYTGKLDNDKYLDWGLGFFIGVQVDSRIFNSLFKK